MCPIFQSKSKTLKTSEKVSHHFSESISPSQNSPETPINLHKIDWKAYRRARATNGCEKWHHPRESVNHDKPDVLGLNLTPPL